MTGPEIMDPMIEFQESAEWKEFEALAAEMSELHNETVEETVEEKDGKRIVTIKRISNAGNTGERREALKAGLETKAAALEAKMAVRESEMEARENKIEGRMIVLEHRIEEDSAEIERLMDERFGPEFEAWIKAQANLIDRLVEACEVAELKTGETQILKRADAEGEVFRLACVEGSRDRLNAAETLAAVDSHPGITAAEKAAFNAGAKGERRTQVMVIGTGAAKAPEPPVPPVPPVPPTVPDPPLQGEQATRPAKSPFSPGPKGPGSFLPAAQRFAPQAGPVRVAAMTKPGR